MTALEGHLADYLMMRRALGYKLERAGQLLPQLVSFLEAAGAATVTAELAIAWAGLPQGVRPQYLAQRLAIARGFAVYLHTIDPAAEVPPSGVFPARRFRPAPYIWSEADVCTLIEQAGALRPRIRAATHATLFGLLAATGMRLGEAIGLEKGDVDLSQGLVTIRHAKYDRVRLVPVHQTVTQALGRYADERDRLCLSPRAQTFFLTSAGTALGRSGVEKVLRQITTAMGIRTAAVHPRAHDLRHRFAIATLIAWHQTGLDVDQHIAVLSTYLGHVAPSDTYWYLSATPELMALAARRLDKHLGARR